MTRPTPWFFLFLPVCSSLVGAQGTIQTLFPEAIPLAVKTPYLNAWYESKNTSAPLANAFPQFWSLGVSFPFFVQRIPTRIGAGVDIRLGRQNQGQWDSIQVDGP